MLESIPITILVATILGFLAGIGVGGGSLLILWLTLIVNTPEEEARLMNLFFFIPSAVIASFFRAKDGTLNIKQLIPAIIGGCAAASILSCIRPFIDAYLIKKAFGILLIATGIREILYKQRSNQRRNAK